MDSMKQQAEIQSILIYGRALQFLRIPLLCFLSFLLCFYSSSLNLSSLVGSLNYQIIVRKHSMFFFGISILLFIAKDSGLLSPQPDLYDELFLIRKGDHWQQAVSDHAKEVDHHEIMSVSESLELVAVEEIRGEAGSSSEVNVDGMEVEGLTELGDVDDGLEVEGLEEVDGVDGMEDLGVDELNKLIVRFEEFIRRVKREWEVEALQLVTV